MRLRLKVHIDVQYSQNGHFPTMFRWEWAFGLYRFQRNPYRLIEHETAQFLITKSFSCLWLFKYNSTLQDYENSSMWYNICIYRICIILRNLEEKFDHYVI
jgi:hypothetical protein